MKLVSTAALVAAMMGGTGSAAAAQQTQRTITFDEAVRIALAQNVAIRQAKNADALNEASVQQQRLAFLPDLRVTANTGQDYGRSFNQSEGRIVDQTTQSLNAGLSSSVTLFDGLRNVANLKSAQLTEAAGNQDLQRAKQTVVFTVASNFLSLVTQQEQLRVQQENLKAQQALAEQIQRFVDAGTRPISDLYQQQASVASAQAAVVNAQRAVELAKVDLMQTLQLDAAGDYQFQAPAVNDSSAAARTYDLHALLERASTQRADLDAVESRADAAEQGVKAAAASKWPSISLSAGYNSGYSSAGDAAFLDQLNQRRGGSIGIGISIPIFDRGSADIATQRAQIQADNAKLALVSQRQQIALEVRRAYLDHEAAKQQLSAAEAQQRAAALATEAAQQRYRVGAATLVELTQARATAVQAASAVVNARYTLVFQQALMSYYTGELDPEHVTLG